MAPTVQTLSGGIMLLLLVILAVLPVPGLSTLPTGCTPLEDHQLDTADPTALFGQTAEIGGKASPHRVGNLRRTGAIPTGHFATNQIKTDKPLPMRLFPYEAILLDDGAVYDAYTLDRWSDPGRTDTMQQQSAWKSGESWNKLVEMGTNLKQVVSGPDGNPGSLFSGKSGVKMGISGSSYPELTEFGDLYATFRYSGNGGSMEVPLVRGSTLLTHHFHNANPIVSPMCLSYFDGHQANFNCPKENSILDAGSGHASGTCSGGTLIIRLDSSKPIPDVTKVQYAASRKSQWVSGNHAMHTCTTTKCRLSNGGKRLEVTIPNASGVMAFAFNYIGHYLTPWNWVPQPAEATCHGKRKAPEKETRSVDEISLHAHCDAGRNLQLDVMLGHNNVNGVNMIQYAVIEYSKWPTYPPMSTCTSRTCSRNDQRVTIKFQAPAHTVGVIINVIGKATLPYDHPNDHPYRLTCGGTDVTVGPLANQVNAPVTHPPVVHTQTPTHTQKPPHTQQPTTPNRNTIHPNTVLNKGTKFVMELKEPGNSLPGKTRKFLLYFQNPVTPHIDNNANTISFQPHNGGKYTGFVQLAYLGAGPKGDHSNDTVLDKYLGVYSERPKASYCARGSRVFVEFDWNLNNQYAHQSPGELLMITMPHHAYNLKDRAASRLKSTVYGFQGYEGSSWLLDFEAPRASMEPDPAGVQRVKANHNELQDVLKAIERDASQANLYQYCHLSDSYGVGKGIGMHARLASISRAFGTNHYQSIDGQIKNCLEKWLRIDDTLSEAWKFHYESVWGGLFLRGTTGQSEYYTDFGFPFYNDHHFHLGYFLYALAYYVRHNRQWGEQHKHRIYMLARDVGNLSYKDRFFPVVRHKDIYMGMSWATGVVPGERQEESSSEALNCYHGLAALGDAYDDPILRGSGQVMLALEIASVREYFHVRQHNFNHFPPLLQNYGVVGQIAEDSFYVYTLDWGCDPNVFPMRHGCLVGIQVIPITAVSKYWMDKDWASHILKTCDYAINPSHAPRYSEANPSDLRQLTSGWKAFCYAAMAPYDDAHKEQAARYIRDKYPRDLVSGTGAASTLLFIYGGT